MIRTRQTAHRAFPFLNSVAATFCGIAVLVGASAAQAEMLCGARDEIVTELKKTWEEDQTAIGLSNSGGVLEVYSSQKGTWTVLMTMPDGPTCMIGAGEHWEQGELPLAGEPV